MQEIYNSEMLKVAIPVRGDFISESFAYCSYYLIYEIKKRKIIGKKVEVFSHEFQEQIINRPDELGITDIIVHRIDNKSLSKFTSTKINLFVGVNIIPPDLLIEKYLNGTITSNTSHITEKC